MGFIGVILLAQLLYLGIWWLIDASKYTETLNSKYSTFFENIYVPECTMNSYFTYIQIGVVAIMIIIGIRLAWSVRKAASEFNESVTLAITFSVLCILLFIFSFIWCCNCSI